MDKARHIKYIIHLVFYLLHSNFYAFIWSCDFFYCLTCWLISYAYQQFKKFCVSFFLFYMLLPCIFVRNFTKNMPFVISETSWLFDITICFKLRELTTSSAKHRTSIMSHAFGNKGIEGSVFVVSNYPITY